MPFEYISSSEHDTFNFGEKIGEGLKAGDLIGLEGNLGVGKTILLKGISKGLKIQEHKSIGSPTFKIVNTYNGNITLYHIDLYRLATHADIISTGLFDLLNDDAIIVIEWADRLKDFEFEFTQYIKLEYIDENKRKISVIK